MKYPNYSQVILMEVIKFTKKIISNVILIGNLLVLAMELTMYDHVIFESFKEKFRNYGLFMIFYIFLQFSHFFLYEQHIYPFIRIMNLGQLIVFEGSLFVISLIWDLLFTKILVRRKWEEIKFEEKDK